MAQCICFRRRLGNAALHVVAWLGISHAHAAEPPKQSIAGSYEILICNGSCAAAGDPNVLVQGRLVLFPTILQQQELAQLHLSTRHMAGRTPNACFGLQKLPGRSYDGYAGIQKAGLTAWSLEGDELLFALYHSPDAGYKVTAERATNGFAGTGQSWGAGVAAPKGSTTDHVVLRRTGAANLSRCPRQKD
jgi:hypothetical protein